MGSVQSPYVLLPRPDLLAFAERDADRTVIWFLGEHDASTADGLWEIVYSAIARDHSDLVIDLSGVEFMGSATTRIINRARESLAPSSRSLTLRSPSRCAKRVLDLCGLVDQLDPRSTDSARAAGSRVIVTRGC